MDIKQLSHSDSRHAPPPASQTPAVGGMSFKINVLRSLRLHALAATVATLLTLGLGLAVLLRHRPTYTAVSQIYVSPTFPATLTPSQEQQYPYDSFVEEQAHSVTQYDVVLDAVHRLKPGVWQRRGESDDSAVQRLQKRLEVKREGMTYQVSVSLWGFQPEHLAEVVNAVTDSYLKKAKGDEFYGRDERLDALRQARAEVQEELNRTLQEQAGLSKDLGVAMLGSDDSDQLDTQVAKLRTDLTSAHEARIQAEAELSSLENNNPKTPSPALNAAADEIIASDPSLLALKSSLSQKRALLLDQLAGLTPNHPLRKATEEELAQTEAGLQKLQSDLRAKAATHLQQQLRTKLNQATTVESRLLGDFQSYTNKATQAAPKFQRAEELKNQITNLQTRYATLDERTRNLELESSSPGSIHLFSRARTPGTPDVSKASKLSPLLLPIALLMGLATAVLIDLLDPRIYSANDIEQILGFSPIGMIFDDREVTMQAFDECALRLAAGVDQAARNVGVRTIVLTAVRSGAGTTSIVESLGSTLAKLGRKTLTIDASGTTSPVAYVTIGLNRGSQKTDSGVNNGKHDSTTQSNAVVAQPISPGLAPLTSFMDQAFRDLTSEYDLVIIDATPLLISAETEYLARFADVTMLITEAGKTKKMDLKRAARLLERLNVRGIAAIVNKVGLRRASPELKEDLEEFETRVSKMNLRWRPSTPPSATAPGFSGTEQPAAKENATYA